MTIDQVVEQKIFATLKDGRYCTTAVAQEIASTTASAVRDALINHEIREVKDDLEKTSLRLERLWTTVDALQAPTKFIRFIHFDWVKFWTWDWSRTKFWSR